MEERANMKAIWAQRKTARNEGERGGTGPNGAKHGSRWLTFQATSDPGEGEMAEGIEEKEEIREDGKKRKRARSSDGHWRMKVQRKRAIKKT